LLQKYNISNEKFVWSVGVLASNSWAYINRFWCRSSYLIFALVISKNRHNSEEWVCYLVILKKVSLLIIGNNYYLENIRQR